MPEPPKAYRDADHHLVSAVIRKQTVPELLVAGAVASATLMMLFLVKKDELAELMKPK